jgi:hypothetical protein
MHPMTFLEDDSNLPFIVRVIHVEPFLYPVLYFWITVFFVFVVLSSPATSKGQ